MIYLHAHFGMRALFADSVEHIRSNAQRMDLVQIAEICDVQDLPFTKQQM